MGLKPKFSHVLAFVTQLDDKPIHGKFAFCLFRPFDCHNCSFIEIVGQSELVVSRDPFKTEEICMSQPEPTDILMDEDKRWAGDRQSGSPKAGCKAADKACFSGPQFAGKREQFTPQGSAPCEDSQTLSVRSGMCPERPW